MTPNSGKKKKEKKARKMNATSSPHPLQTDRIPHEIWLHIIDFSYFERSDLVNLCLTSKFLGWVIQPLLFRSLTFTHTRTFTWLPGCPRGDRKSVV